MDEILHVDGLNRLEDLECNKPKTIVRHLSGWANAAGAWSPVIGTFSYTGTAKCGMLRRCDCSKGCCPWKFVMWCDFEFEAMDKYDFLASGEPIDDPGLAGILEEFLFNPTILHWKWNTHAWAMLDCQCPGHGTSIPDE